MLRITALLLALLWSLSAAAQGRMPKAVGAPEDPQATEPEDVEYLSATLTGVKELRLSVSDIPKLFTPCGTKEDVIGIVTARFAKEANAPKLGKGGDLFLSQFELWLETTSDSPNLFPKAKIPEDMVAIVPRMRVITFTPPEKGSAEKPHPALPFEGNAIWWGTPEDCKKGLDQALQAMLDRFFEQYRTANPGSRLPK